MMFAHAVDLETILVLIAFAGAFLFLGTALRKITARFNNAAWRLIRRCLGIGDRSAQLLPRPQSGEAQAVTDTAPRETAASGDAYVKGYFQRAWMGLLELLEFLRRARDEQGITWTLILNGYLLLLGVFFAVTVLSLSHGKIGEPLWSALFVWLVFVVGMNARALVQLHWAFGWAFKLIALLVFGSLAFIALGLHNDFVILGHWLLGR
jgi:hypothetical protein